MVTLAELTENNEVCPFCRPGISGTAFMESTNFIAIYNISPVLPGHSLVIPRRHAESMMDLSETELSEFSLFAVRVTRFLREVFHGDGFDWSVQEGKSAGQSVPHLHMHIVIRKTGDLPADTEWYPLLRENEFSLFDIQQRSRLTESEYNQITAMLQQEADRQNPSRL